VVLIVESILLLKEFSLLVLALSVAEGELSEEEVFIYKNEVESLDQLFGSYGMGADPRSADVGNDLV